MQDKHIVTSFDRELEGVQIDVVKMGGMVEAALKTAIKALVERDTDLAHRVVAGDHDIDALELKIKTDTARLLALRAPTATDLRLVLAVMEISAHLERCGDYAKNIAKRTVATAEGDAAGAVLGSLRRMADFVLIMVGDALDAFIKRDAGVAAEIIRRDEEADEMYNTVFRSLLTHMMEDHRNITVGMQLHFIAKNIERVGDHATGIAEQTIYLVTGSRPDDERPKMDRTTLLQDTQS
ncbi:phosphate signaling complex protein PhoU [Loktanella fryxellensis]|nr:phosphate signaling complex protein PhoU [Loktanella fryxellensis]